MGKFACASVSIFMLCFCIKTINSSCLLELPAITDDAPNYFRHFGTKNLKIPVLNVGRYVKLYDGETIIGHCGTEFNPIKYEMGIPESMQYHDSYGYYRETTTLKPSSYYYNFKTIELQCTNEEIYLSPFYERLSSELSCKSVEWSLYETKMFLPWCHPGTDSYILATSNDDTNSMIAAICFNLTKMSLESIRFRAIGEHSKADKKDLKGLTPRDLGINLLANEVKHFDSLFGNEDADRQYADQIPETVEYDLLNVGVYKKYSIIPYGPHKKLFLNYQKLLKINWWHNLRYGNWERFTLALNKRTANVTYDVFMGTSGTVSVPQQECQRTKALELNSFRNVEILPAYIWTFLKSADESEEFVFIAYNSPFYDFFGAEKIIFCKDICSEIAWLDEIRSTFRYSTLGVTFCCTPDDVRDSGMLNGFPRKYDAMSVFEPASTTETTESTETPETETTADELISWYETVEYDE